MKQCPECQTPISPAAKSCPRCGYKRKSRLTAACLAFFLGGLGAHELYLGRPKVAACFFLASATGFGVVLAVVAGWLQAMSWLRASDDDFAAWLVAHRT
jgi:TM2 domain-containing membrane protein YozV